MRRDRHAADQPLPVLWLGRRLTDGLPLAPARNLAAMVFFVLAIWVAWRGIG